MTILHISTSAWGQPNKVFVFLGQLLLVTDLNVLVHYNFWSSSSSKNWQRLSNGELFYSKPFCHCWFTWNLSVVSTVGCTSKSSVWIPFPLCQARPTWVIHESVHSLVTSSFRFLYCLQNALNEMLLQCLCTTLHCTAMGKRYPPCAILQCLTPFRSIAWIVSLPFYWRSHRWRTVLLNVQMNEFYEGFDLVVLCESSDNEHASCAEYSSTIQFIATKMKKLPLESTSQRF